MDTIHCRIALLFIERIVIAPLELIWSNGLPCNVVAMRIKRIRMIQVDVMVHIDER